VPPGAVNTGATRRHRCSSIPRRRTGRQPSLGTASNAAVADLFTVSTQFAQMQMKGPGQYAKYAMAKQAERTVWTSSEEPPLKLLRTFCGLKVPWTKR